MPLPSLAGVLAAAALLHSPDSTRSTGSSSNGGAKQPAATAPAPVLAPEPAPAPLLPPAPVAMTSRHVAAADSLVVEKAAHRLTLYYRGAPVRTYSVALGNPVGDKQRKGDRRTPVGLYHIDSRNPQSRFHLALHISYPDERHAARARAAGVAPGGDLMIHGLPNGQGDVGADHRQDDWTNGCVAVTDEEIEEIWSAVPIGTPIEIKP